MKLRSASYRELAYHIIADAYDSERGDMAIFSYYSKWDPEVSPRDVLIWALMYCGFREYDEA